MSESAISLVQPEDNSGVVATLEEALADARAGKLRAVAMVLMTRDGSWATRNSGCRNTMELCGMIATAGFAVQQQLREDR